MPESPGPSETTEGNQLMRWTASGVIVAALIFVGLLYFRSPSFPTSAPAPSTAAAPAANTEPSSPATDATAPPAALPTLAAAETVPGFEAGNGPNLAFERQDFAASVWTPEGLSATGDAGPAPDGTHSAFRLAEAASSGRHRTEALVTGITPGGVYTLSIYLKPAGRRLVMFEMRDKEHDKKYGVARFDLEHKTVFAKLDNTKDAGIQELPDHWLRCWAAMPYDTDSAVFDLSLMDNQVAVLYPGNPNDAVLAWGVQLEPGERPKAFSSNGEQTAH